MELAPCLYVYLIFLNYEMINEKRKYMTKSLVAIRSVLSAAYMERLAILSEELGENQQVIGKILRHGPESFNPFDTNQRTNTELLEDEVGDVLLGIGLMLEAGDINSSNIKRRICDKVEKIKTYIHEEENILLLDKIQKRINHSLKEINNG